MAESKIIRVKLTLKQTKCWDAFWDPLINQILFGGYRLPTAVQLC